jgi:NitT/TauT family transport system substrate-binding protein
MTNRLCRVALAAAALVLTTCLAACISIPGDDGDRRSDAVRIGTLRGQPHLFHPFFMKELATDGGSYEIVLFDNSPDMKNAIVSGSIDFAVLGVPSMLAGVAAGEDVRIIASAANGGFGFVGKPDIATVDDLRGRRIAYPAGATQEILLKLILEKNGLDPKQDVTLVNLPFSDMANAYRSEQVDAFMGAEVGPSIALNAGAKNIASPYDTPIGGVNIAFGTRASLIEQNPELVGAVVKDLAAATDYMAAHPDEWATKVVNEFGLDPDVIKTAITNIYPRWQLDEEYRRHVAALAELMVAFDQISGAPDMSKVFDTTFVDAVNSVH